MIPRALPTRRTLAIGAFAAAILALLSAPAHAQWPAGGKPLRIIVGFPAGGGADVLARAIQQPLSEKLGTPVVVENRPGAGGMTGTDYVAKSAPDGYTVYLATPGAFTIWPNLRKLPYDPVKDFAPVSLLVTMPNLLVVSANAPFTDVRSIIAAAKAPGSKVDYASGGIATLDHIMGEQFNMLAGISMNHIAYKGTAPKVTDVMAGVVPITFADPSTKPMIESGKLRMLAVTTARRSRLFPDTPTMAEAGVPGYEAMNWYGIVAPVASPPEAVQKMNAALVEIMARPDMRKRLEGVGMDPTSSTPAEFSKLIAGERDRWGALIVKANIKAE